MQTQLKEVTLRVFRQDPKREKKHRYQTYKVPYRRGLTVLDSLIYIKENLDPTLSIRYSCRMASCGSCGMMINGLPRLACFTQVTELKTETITVEPLRSFPLIKDLVTSFDDFFKKHHLMLPYLIRRDAEEQENPTHQYLQTDEELERYIQFTYCIRCGLCYAACPVTATDRNFPGPMALAQLYRYYADTRDEGGEERLKVIDNTHGIWRCHFADSCSQVCPKGVDPALAIQLLRRAVMFNNRKR
ncbi:MAG TPA: succinate dehydrogenase iron-sulfur subunit [Candidatus Caldiarchaeum subterraneum]|uniref:succinate dehydrogenase n=1 Tax=Caldiarchaeum subterraneum TaxID=311458 RepID=A0A833A5D9_CALS0|nr:succinate dehydrogenase iron-sulfur subunit [Aigarchaeota archaeon]HIQ30318.1 succinate dehydrogenase iron-sulfur subunit [Candidatus Caldarchaeum subterraneum]